jgi:hypothetical protein
VLGIAQAFIDGVPLATLAKLALVDQPFAAAVHDASEADDFSVTGDVDAAFPPGVG